LFLEAYEKVFPEARFVQTHRDVSKVLPSVSDLYYTMLQIGNPTIDPLYVGELNMHQWGLALDRCLEFRDDPARDAKFFDIGFTEFQADPIGQIRKLYDWLGDDLDAGTVDRMRAWRADNPKDKHGKHAYDASQFGITDEALEKRFGGYRERFAPYLS
jgi:Fe-S-cluster formation regulator IscX/YfhJ